MSAKASTCGIKGLEITMRDVLDGMEDAASYVNYRSVPDTVEILSIEPPGRAILPQQEVIQFAKRNSANSIKSTDIVDYLIQRELKRSA